MQEPVESIYQEKTLIQPIVYDIAALNLGGATMKAKLKAKSITVPITLGEPILVLST